MARERIVVGDAEADDGGFASFYRAQYGSMARLAGLLTGSNLVNEDLAQEALLGLRARFAEVADPRAYLRQATVNRCRRWHRDNQRQQRRLRVLASGSRDQVGLEREELADVIEQLPYRQRVVIVGRYWAGWTEKEIAEALGCRPGTVKSLASRALAHLREQIEDRDS